MHHIKHKLSLTLLTAAIPLIILLGSPFLFAFSQEFSSPAHNACHLLGYSIPLSSAVGLIHQLFARHNRELLTVVPDAPPWFWELISISLFGVLGGACWLAHIAEHGWADVLLSSFSISISLFVSIMRNRLRRVQHPAHRTSWCEAGLLLCLLWVITTSSLPHFQAHETWSVSGVAAVVALAHMIYFGDIYRETSSSGSNMHDKFA
jgi:hypothetical protein